MYQVLARKWRPQTFDQLIGQQHVGKTLANAIQTDRLAHAYIFAGLRGTGKTSAARILAKCLNCETGPTVTPCGTCAPCTEIAASQAIDVMEIDAASRTKVEQTRELLELVSYAPARDRYKILIIDEAHMLSKASFNALLKTLEEPPPNVLFVLATTELQKILPTILSRCQVFDFHRVGPKDIATHLRRLCGEEGIEISDASLERIARAGEGSVRDALSVLERVVAFCGEQAADEDVLRVLGAVRTETLVGMVRAIASREAAEMLGVLDTLVDEGHDLVHFWGELLGALRDLMLLRAAPGQQDLLARSEAEAEALAEAAGDLGIEDLTRVFQILADLEPALKSSGQPRYLFEAALVRIAGLGVVRPIEDVLAGLGPGGGPSGGGSTGASRRASPQRKAAPAARPKPASRDGAPASAPPIAAAPPAEDPQEPVRVAPAAAAPAPTGQAGDFVALVHDKRPMLAAILEQAPEIRIEGGNLVIGFPEGQAALKRQLERKDNREALARCAEESLGTTLNVMISTIGEGAPSAEPASPAKPAAAPAETTTSAPAPARPQGSPGAAAADRKQLLRQATREPGVEKLMMEFGAQVVDVSPLAAPEDEDMA
jgi:DNA polymerase-3 subunit gamma/tau